MTLAEYVTTHTHRGECQCGRCIDSGTTPDPTGHTVDLTLFKVAAVHDPDRATFEALTKAHPGIFNEVDIWDGHEHNYIELGGWLGDQGLALLFMALGHLLGSFTLLTPETMMPFLPLPDKMHMATNGMIAITVRTGEVGAC